LALPSPPPPLPFLPHLLLDSQGKEYPVPREVFPGNDALCTRNPHASFPCADFYPPPQIIHTDLLSSRRQVISIWFPQFPSVYTDRFCRMLNMQSLLPPPFPRQKFFTPPHIFANEVAQHFSRFFYNSFGLPTHVRAPPPINSWMIPLPRLKPLTGELHMKDAPPFCNDRPFLSSRLGSVWRSLNFFGLPEKVTLFLLVIPLVFSQSVGLTFLPFFPYVSGYSPWYAFLHS